MTDRPEIEMVRRALVPAALTFVVATTLAWVIAGPNAGVSAALAVVIVSANFAAHGWSLAWASKISIPAVQAVALGGLVVRMAVIVGLLFVLRVFDWFSPTAFVLTVAPATMLLLAYEARLAIRGVGAVLQIPADPAAIRAAAILAVQEAR